MPSMLRTARSNRSRIALVSGAGDVLDVGVSKTGRDDAAGIQCCGDHYPNAVLCDPQVPQQRGSGENHGNGIGCVIQHSVGGVRKMSSHSAPTLR